MDAIVTKYHGQTNRTGSRISARFHESRVYVPYDDGLSETANHARAVAKLCERIGLPHERQRSGSIRFVAGGIPGGGYAWVRQDNGWDTEVARDTEGAFVHVGA